MRITREMIEPSRPDAVRLNRGEKISVLFLSHAASVLDDLVNDLAERMKMVEGGQDRVQKLAEEANSLLHDVRMTIPENQRMNLQHTVEDYEIRMTPKLTPSITNVVVQKEEFRTLVDAARVKCTECTDSCEECEKCELFKLLTVILPLESYDGTMLCPYNLGVWAN